MLERLPSSARSHGRRCLSALVQLRPKEVNVPARVVAVNVRKPVDSVQVATAPKAVALPKRNEVGVQLLSRRLHEQIFPHAPFPRPPSNFVSIAKEHLKLHGLDPKQGSNLPDLAFTLPPLQGHSIDEHFYNIGKEVAEPYLSLAQQFSDTKDAPRQPSQWAIHQGGWTKYFLGETPSDDYYVHVDSPEEQLLCFDVETLPNISPYAIMATAVSPTHWYSWISPWLLGESDDPEHLIPLGDPSVPRIVVGHNVSYDRARIKEEYSLERSATRFIDTMSLHVAVKGISSHQRPAWNKWKKQKKETIEVVETMIQDTNLKLQREGSADDQSLVDLQGDLQQSLVQLQSGDDESNEKRWEEITSANSLADVALLHCGIHLDKGVRDDFLTATREDVLEDMDKYLQYCGGDVNSTYAVYRAVFPKFLEACPSPVSFAGVMSMGSAFLPVNQEWEKYLERAESKYRELERGVKTELQKLANEALLLASPSTADNAVTKWADDVWLSQLDWTSKSVPRGTPSKVEEELIPAFLATVYTFTETTCTRSTVIPLLLQTRYYGYPLFFSRETGWLYAVKKGTVEESSKIEAPELDKETGGIYTFFAAWAPIVRGILAPSNGARFLRKGALAFAHGEDGLQLAELMCTVRVTDNPAAVAKMNFLILKIAQQVAKAGRPKPVRGIRKGEPGDNTWWGDQLDWTLVPRPVKSKRGKPVAQQVPAWYRELMTGPASGETETTGDNLHLTVRTRTAPLLLKLCWRGYPLFHSRQHGWMYRVPREQCHKIPTQEKEQTFKLKHDVDKLGGMIEAFAFFKLPHKDGEEANVGSPLTKTFLKYLEDGTMTSPSSATRKALDMNAQSSYWISARDRVLNQVVVWDKERLSMGFGERKDDEKWGLIIPQVITMGTVTRRAIEKTWLTASNAKANRIGSELKALVRAPPGYAIVGADVDSEELWISSVMGDAQFGLHGATAIGWMTLEGTKAAGTDLHSKTASILGISRNEAKVFNYSRIYGAGMKHASLLLLQSNPGMSIEKAQELASELYAKTKGRNTHRADIFDRKFWFGGSESFVFNKLEEIAMSDRPQTPALGCGVTDALAKEYLPQKFGSDYLPSRINWVVQSSGVDYLHLLIVAMEHLVTEYSINARYLISVHDELRYLVTEEDKYRAALALQIANMWTRCQFAWRLGMDDLPQGVAFFSAVDIDWLLRKEVDMPCVTPSQPTPLAPGESLDMQGILDKTHGGSLMHDGSPMSIEAKVPHSPEYVAPDHMLHRARTSHFLKAQSTQEFGEVKLMASLATGKTFFGEIGGSRARTEKQSA